MHRAAQVYIRGDPRAEVGDVDTYPHLEPRNYQQLIMFNFFSFILPRVTFDCVLLLPV